MDQFSGVRSSAEEPLFARQGDHELFTPAKTYPPVTAGELASFGDDAKGVQ